MRLPRHFAAFLPLSLLFCSLAFAQNNLHDFTSAAIGGAQSTKLLVSTGVALIGTTPTQIPSAVLTLTASATNYIYVDTVAGTISFNTSGFTATEYPVATAVTDSIHITSLTDDRWGAYAAAGSSAGGTVTSATIAGTSGQLNVAGTCTITTTGTCTISIPSSFYTNASFFPFQSITATGTSGAATLSAGVLNIPNYTYTLPAATSSALGGVKPDGTTISNSSGAISLNLANANTWTATQTFGVLNINATATSVFTMGAYGVNSTYNPSTTITGSSPSYNSQWGNQTASTSGANVNGPGMGEYGTVWNGSSSITDEWGRQVVVGTGANPTSTYLFAHDVNSSTGFAAVQVPNLIVGSITSSTSPVCPNGTNAALTTSGCTGGGGSLPSGNTGLALRNTTGSTTYAAASVAGGIDATQFLTGSVGTCTPGTNDDACIANAIAAVPGTPSSGSGGYAVIDDSNAGAQVWTTNPFKSLLSNGTSNITAPVKCGQLILSGGSTVTTNVPITVPRCWDVKVVSQFGQAATIVASSSWPGIYTTGTVTTAAPTTISSGQYQFVVTGIGTTFTSNVVVGEEFGICQGTNNPGANGPSCGGNGTTTCSVACGTNAAGQLTYGMVLAVTDNTHLIIGTANANTGVANASGVNYVIKAPLIWLGAMGADSGDSGGASATWHGGTISCANKAGCSAFVNFSEQENSSITDVVIENVVDTYLDVEGINAVNSGPYDRMVMNASSSCVAGTRAIITRVPGTLHPIENVTVNFDGCPATGGAVAVDFEEGGDFGPAIHYENTGNTSGTNVFVNVGENSGAVPMTACPVYCPQQVGIAAGAYIHGLAVSGTGGTGINIGSNGNTQIQTKDNTVSFTNVIVDNARSCSITSATGDSTIGAYDHYYNNNYFGTAQNIANSCGSGGDFPGVFTFFGTTSGSATIGASATGSLLDLNGTNATVSTGGALTVTSCTGCGSGGPGTGTQYDPAGWATTSTLGSIAPTSGYDAVPQVQTATTTSGAFTALPSFVPPGVVPNPSTCPSNVYTYLLTDRMKYVSFSDASACAVTLPQAGSTGFGLNFVNVSCDIGAGTATITPTTSTISYSTGSAYTSAASTMPLTTGQCAWIYSDNTNYFAIKFSGGSGGDTITSPNSTLAIGGTATNTTLDLEGSAGEIMAGATPALTYTPTLGKSGTAGTLAMFPASGNFTTTLGSSATASNTFVFPATVFTTGHLGYCATSSTTCTWTDAGYSYNALPLADHATQTANTLVANVTGSTAVPTAAAIPAGVQFYTAGTGYSAATAAQLGTVLNIASGLVLYSGGTAAAPVGSTDWSASATTLTAAAAGILNMGSATGTAALVVPSNTTNTASAAGVLDFDTTNKNYHGYVNGADSLFLNSAAALTTNVIPKAVIATGNMLMANSLLTDTGTTATYTGTGGMAAPVFTSTGTTAGFADYPQGTTSAAVAPCNTANSICDQAPTAVTAGVRTIPGVLAPGLLTNVGSSSALTQGYTGDSGHYSGQITWGTGTSIGTTSLCSTTVCPVGLYRVALYIDVTTACTTTGSYIVWLTYTDDQGAKTATPIPIEGPGSTFSTGVLVPDSTADYGTGYFVLRSTGAAAISYGSTAAACGTGGPAVGKFYLTIEPLSGS